MFTFSNGFVPLFPASPTLLWNGIDYVISKISCIKMNSLSGIGLRLHYYWQLVQIRLFVLPWYVHCRAAVVDLFIVFTFSHKNKTETSHVILKTDWNVQALSRHSGTDLFKPKFSGQFLNEKNLEYIWVLFFYYIY